MITLHLPEAKDAKAEALTRLLTDARRDQNVAAVEWYVTRHYLRGCRYFDTISYESGVVRPSYKDSSGGIPFKHEELINIFVTEVGRLMRLDTAPAIKRASVGLDGLRKESVADAVLRAINLRLPASTIKRSYGETLVMYGAAGLYAYQTTGDEADSEDPLSNVGLEVVPPWELLFLPANAKLREDVAAVARQRWVPLAWLKALQVAGKPISIGAEDDPDLEVREFPPGSSVRSTGLGDSQPNSTSSTHDQYEEVNPGSSAASRKPTSKNEKYVRLCEVWVSYPNTRLRDIFIMAGKKLVHEQHWKNNRKTPLIPLSWSSRGEAIGMYGRSTVGPLVPLCVETEAAMQNLLRNVRDLDFMGTTAISQALGIDQTDLASSLEGRRRYFMMDPDPTSPATPAQSFFRIEPHTSGTMPTAILNMAFSMIQRLSQQPEMVSQGTAPGRVDSNSAIQSLYQMSTMPLSVLASSIASAFAGAYRALLQFASKWDNIRLNVETLLDEAMIGIVFDAATGNMDFATNTLPDPLSVDVGIASEKPVSAEARKLELDNLLAGQLITQMQYRIQARLEHLDLPLGNDEEWQNYRMAILRSLLLFGDGETPGVLPNHLEPSEYDIPEVHLMVLHRLMASPEFAMASDAVQTGFSKYAEFFTRSRGDYPEQMPNPEDMGAPGGEEMGMDQMGGMGEESGMGQMGGGPGQNDQAQMMAALQQMGGGQ